MGGVGAERLGPATPRPVPCHRLTRHHDDELVDTGPYRFVRHPIYAAIVLAFVGIGAVLGNWVGLLLTGIVPTRALVVRIEVEERELANALGTTYEWYASRRHRLVPWVW